MGQYVDSNLLNMANPANSKNELQAIGDGFKEMYNNYIRNRLSQNEIDLSDLRLGYERATQDDRIRAIKLGTENLANEVQKGAIDLDIARQTKDEKIAQEQIKTANDMEALKQSQIKTGFLPNMLKAEINQANASASNLFANARQTNFATNVAKSRFNEEETTKSLYSNVNEYSQKSGKQGEDAFDGYYNGLYLKYLDAKQQGFDTSAYEREISLLNKHKPSIMQMYKVQFDGANPYVKNSGNSANSTNDYFGVLDKVSQISDTKENLKKELKDIDSKIQLADNEERLEDVAKLEQRKDELKNNLKQYENINIPNVGVIHTLGALQQIYGKEEGLNRQNELENLAAQKKLLNAYAGLIEEANWHGWSGNVVNKSLNFLGHGTIKDNLREVAKQIKVLAQTKSMKLKQQYEIFASLVDDDSLFGQNDERLMQNARLFDNFLNTQVDSVLTAFNDRQKNMIKQGVKYDLKPVESYFKNKPKKTDYQQNKMTSELLKQYPNATGINSNGLPRYY